MQKWDYCVVNSDESDAYVEYWEAKGPDRVALRPDAGMPGDTVYRRVRRVIAQLGDRNWELVGVGGGLFYFRRARQ
jgi:hypothetical protein